MNADNVGGSKMGTLAEVVKDVMVSEFNREDEESSGAEGVVEGSDPVEVIEGVSGPIGVREGSMVDIAILLCRN